MASHFSTLLHLRAILLIALISVSCERASLPEPTSTAAVRLTCPPTDNDDYFFPTSALIPNSDARDHEQSIALSTYLRSTSARSLSCGEQPGNSAYRLLRTGDLSPAFDILVTQRGKGWSVDMTERNGSVVSRLQTNRQISTDEIESLLAALEETGFWTMPAFLDVEGEGQVWVVEGRRDASYKVVTFPMYQGRGSLEKIVRAFHAVADRRLD